MQEEIDNLGLPVAVRILGVNQACFDAFRAVYECAVPVVCAVNDFCLGTGIGLAGSADVVLAGEGAVATLAGDGTGEFGYPLRTTIGGNPALFEAARFDADPHLDLVLVECAVDHVPADIDFPGRQSGFRRWWVHFVSLVHPGRLGVAGNT